MVATQLWKARAVGISLKRGQRLPKKKTVACLTYDVLDFVKVATMASGTSRLTVNKLSSPIVRSNFQHVSGKADQPFEVYTVTVPPSVTWAWHLYDCIHIVIS